MDDGDTTVMVSTAAGPRAFHATLDAGGNYTFQSTPRTQGGQVDDANPMPVQAPAARSVASPSIENGRILLALPGKLFALQANATVSGFVLLFDAASLPLDGAVAPRKAWHYDHTTLVTIDKTFDPPLDMTVGAVVVFSTGATPFTLTSPGSPAAQFSAEIG